MRNEDIRFYSPMHGGVWRGRRGRDSQEHRAVEYARWLAQRDGAPLPNGRISVTWRRAPDGKRRPCAVWFGAACITIPHWDHIETPPQVTHDGD